MSNDKIMVVMKQRNKLYIFLLTAFVAWSAIGSLVSCGSEESESGGDVTIGDVTIKKANIKGAKMLALASETPEEGSQTTIGVNSMLYKVNDNGVLEEVSYTFEINTNDSEIAEFIQQSLRLTIYNMVPIGDKWLWLSHCRYIIPNPGDIPVKGHEKQEAIWSLLNQKFGSGEFEYLVRKSDGALFEWRADQGCPYNTGSSHSELQASEIYGIVEPYGSDLLTADPKSHQYTIMRIKDQGNQLEVSTVTPTTAYAFDVLPTKHNYVGSHISYKGTSLFYDGGRDPYIVLVDEAKVININMVAPPERFVNEDGSYNSSCIMVSLDGELYLLRTDWQTIKNGWDERTTYLSEVLRVKVNGNTATTEVVASFDGQVFKSFDWDSSLDLTASDRVFKGKTMSWFETWSSDLHIFTFDPTAQTISHRPLPEHYPIWLKWDYFDGVAYTVEYDGKSLPACFYRCDLSEEEAEAVPLTWDDTILSYSSQIVWNTFNMSYNHGSQALLGYIMLLDGRYLSFRTDVSGPERGKVHVMLDGEETAGKVISTMIRLN